MNYVPLTRQERLFEQEQRMKEFRKKNNKTLGDISKEKTSNDISKLKLSNVLYQKNLEKHLNSGKNIERIL